MSYSHLWEWLLLRTPSFSSPLSSIVWFQNGVWLRFFFFFFFGLLLTTKVIIAGNLCVVVGLFRSIDVQPWLLLKMLLSLYICVYLSQIHNFLINITWLNLSSCYLPTISPVPWIEYQSNGHSHWPHKNLIKPTILLLRQIFSIV